MFEKISEFFRVFFDLIFKDLRGLFSRKKEEVVLVEPAPEELEPQDGADIPQDTVVVIKTDLGNEVILPEEPVEIEPEKPEVPVVESEPEPEKPKDTTPKQRYLWCLDNGHGKLTAGKRSPKLKDGNRFFEYEFNRIIVKGIIKELDKKGIKYYNVVPEVNVNNFLQGRVIRANNVPSKIPKIFLSVHANAGPGTWTSASGLETWHYNNSPTGEKLATVFQRHLVAQLGWRNRGIKSQATKQFYVIRKTNMPAILTENGFYNNRTEVYKLLDKTIQQKIIQAHVDAIVYFETHGV